MRNLAASLGSVTPFILLVGGIVGISLLGSGLANAAQGDTGSLDDHGSIVSDSGEVHVVANENGAISQEAALEEELSFQNGLREAYQKHADKLEEAKEGIVATDAKIKALEEELKSILESEKTKVAPQEPAETLQQTKSAEEQELKAEEPVQEPKTQETQIEQDVKVKTGPKYNYTFGKTVVVENSMDVSCKEGRKLYYQKKYQEAIEKFESVIAASDEEIGGSEYAGSKRLHSHAEHVRRNAQKWIERAEYRLDKALEKAKKDQPKLKLAQIDEPVIEEADVEFPEDINSTIIVSAAPDITRPVDPTVVEKAAIEKSFLGSRKFEMELRKQLDAQGGPVFAEVSKNGHNDPVALVETHQHGRMLQKLYRNRSPLLDAEGYPVWVFEWRDQDGYFHEKAIRHYELEPETGKWQRIAIPEKGKDYVIIVEDTMRNNDPASANEIWTGKNYLNKLVVFHEYGFATYLQELEEAKKHKEHLVKSGIFESALATVVLTTEISQPWVIPVSRIAFDVLFTRNDIPKSFPKFAEDHPELAYRWLRQEAKKNESWALFIVNAIDNICDATGLSDEDVFKELFDSDYIVPGSRLQIKIDDSGIGVGPKIGSVLKLVTFGKAFKDSPNLWTRRAWDLRFEGFPLFVPFEIMDADNYVDVLEESYYFGVKDEIIGDGIGTIYESEEEFMEDLRSGDIVRIGDHPMDKNRASPLAFYKNHKTNEVLIPGRKAYEEGKLEIKKNTAKYQNFREWLTQGGLMLIDVQTGEKKVYSGKEPLVAELEKLDQSGLKLGKEIETANWRYKVTYEGREYIVLMNFPLEDITREKINPVTGRKTIVTYGYVDGGFMRLKKEVGERFISAEFIYDEHGVESQRNTYVNLSKDRDNPKQGPLYSASQTKPYDKDAKAKDLGLVKSVSYYEGQNSKFRTTEDIRFDRYGRNIGAITDRTIAEISYSDDYYGGRIRVSSKAWVNLGDHNNPQKGGLDFTAQTIEFNKDKGEATERKRYSIGSEEKYSSEELVTYDIFTGWPKVIEFDNEVLIYNAATGKFIIEKSGRTAIKSYYEGSYGMYGIADRVETVLIDQTTGAQELVTTSMPVESYNGQRGYHLVYQIKDERKSNAVVTTALQEVKDGQGLLKRKYVGYFDRQSKEFVRQRLIEFDYHWDEEWAQYRRPSYSRNYIYDPESKDHRGSLKSETITKGWFSVETDAGTRIIGIQAERKDWWHDGDFSSMVKSAYSEDYFGEHVVSRIDNYKNRKTLILYDKYGDEESSQIFDLAFHPTLVGPEGKVGTRQAEKPILTSKTIASGIMKNPYYPDLPEQYYLIKGVTIYNHRGQALYTASQWFNRSGEMVLEAIDKKNGKTEKAEDISYYFSSADWQEICCPARLTATSREAGHNFAMPRENGDISGYEFLYFLVGTKEANQDGIIYNLVVRDAHGKEVALGKDHLFWKPYTAHKEYYPNKKSPIRASAVVVKPEDIMNKAEFVKFVSIKQLRELGIDTHRITNITLKYSAKEGQEKLYVGNIRLLGQGDIKVEKIQGIRAFVSDVSLRISKWLEKKTQERRFAFSSRGDILVDKIDGETVQKVYKPDFTPYFDKFDYKYESEKGITKTATVRLYYDTDGKTPLFAVEFRTGSSPTVYLQEELDNYIFQFRVDPHTGHAIKDAYKVDDINPDMVRFSKRGNNIFLPFMQNGDLLDRFKNRRYNNFANVPTRAQIGELDAKGEAIKKEYLRYPEFNPANIGGILKDVSIVPPYLLTRIIHIPEYEQYTHSEEFSLGFVETKIREFAQYFKAIEKFKNPKTGLYPSHPGSKYPFQAFTFDASMHIPKLVLIGNVDAAKKILMFYDQASRDPQTGLFYCSYDIRTGLPVEYDAKTQNPIKSIVRTGPNAFYVMEAVNYYLLTGDNEHLATAFEIAKNLIVHLQDETGGFILGPSDREWKGHYSVEENIDIEGIFNMLSLPEVQEQLEHIYQDKAEDLRKLYRESQQRYSKWMVENSADKDRNLMHRGVMKAKVIGAKGQTREILMSDLNQASDCYSWLFDTFEPDKVKATIGDPDRLFANFLALFVVQLDIPEVGKVAGVDFNISIGREDAIFPEQTGYLVQSAWRLKWWHQEKALELKAQGNDKLYTAELEKVSYYSNVIEYFLANIEKLRNSKLCRNGLLPYAISMRNGKVVIEGIETGHSFASPVCDRKKGTGHISIITHLQDFYANIGFIPNQPYGGKHFREIIEKGQLEIKTPSSDIEKPVFAYSWPLGAKVATILSIFAGALILSLGFIRHIRRKASKAVVGKTEQAQGDSPDKANRKSIEKFIAQYITEKLSGISEENRNDIVARLIHKRVPKRQTGLRKAALTIRGKPVLSYDVTASKIWARAITEGLINEGEIKDIIKAALDKYELDVDKNLITIKSDLTICSLVYSKNKSISFKSLNDMFIFLQDILVLEALEAVYGGPVVGRLIEMLVDETGDPQGKKEAIGKHIEKIIHRGDVPTYEEVVNITIRQIVWEMAHLWGAKKRNMGIEHPFVDYLQNKLKAHMTQNNIFILPAQWHKVENSLKEELRKIDATISQWQDFVDLLIVMMDNFIEGKMRFASYKLADGSEQIAIVNKDGSDAWSGLIKRAQLEKANLEKIQEVFRNQEAISALRFLFEGTARKVGLFGKIGLVVKNIYKYQPDESANYYFEMLKKHYLGNNAGKATNRHIEDEAFELAGRKTTPDFIDYLKFSKEFVARKEDWASISDAGMYPKLWALGLVTGIVNIVWTWLATGRLDNFGTGVLIATALHVFFATIKNGPRFFKTIKDFWLAFDHTQDGKPILFGTKEKIGFAKIGLWIVWNTIILSAGKAFFVYLAPHAATSPLLPVLILSFIFLYGMLKLGTWAYMYFVESAFTGWLKYKEKEEMPNLLPPLVDMPSVSLLHPLMKEAFGLSPQELLGDSFEVALATLRNKRSDLYRKIIDKNTEKKILQEIEKERRAGKVLITVEAAKKVLNKRQIAQIIKMARKHNLGASNLDFLKESYIDSYKELIAELIKEGNILTEYRQALEDTINRRDFRAYHALLDKLIAEGKDEEALQKAYKGKDRVNKEVIEKLTGWANEYEPAVLPTLLEMVNIRDCYEEWFADYYGINKEANQEMISALAQRKVFIGINTSLNRKDVGELCDKYKIWRPISEERQFNKAACEAVTMARTLASDLWMNYEKGCRADESSQRRFLNFMCEFSNQEIDIALPERDMANRKYSPMTRTYGLGEQGFGRVFLHGEAVLYGPGHYGWHCAVRSDATIESSAVRRTIISEDLITALLVYLHRRPIGKGRGVYATYIRLTKQREVANEQTLAALGRWAKGFIQLLNTRFVQSYLLSPDISWAEKDARLMRGGFLTTMSVWAVTCTMLLPLIAVFGMDPLSFLPAASTFVILGLLHNQAIQWTIAVLFIKCKGLWEGIGHLIRILPKNILWFPAGQLLTFRKNTIDGMTKGTTTLFVRSPGRTMRDSLGGKDLWAFWKTGITFGLTFLVVLQVAMFVHNMNLYSYLAAFLATCVALSFLMFSFIFNSPFGVPGQSKTNSVKFALSSAVGLAAALTVAAMLSWGGLYISWPWALAISGLATWAVGFNSRLAERFVIRNRGQLWCISIARKAFWLSLVILLNVLIIPLPISFLPPASEMGAMVIARSALLGLIGLAALYVQCQDVREAFRIKKGLSFGSRMLWTKLLPLPLAISILPVLALSHRWQLTALNLVVFALVRAWSVGWEFKQSRKRLWEMKEWVYKRENAPLGTNSDVVQRHGFEELKDVFVRITMAIDEKFYKDIRRELKDAENTFRKLEADLVPTLMAKFVELLPEKEKGTKETELLKTRQTLSQTTFAAIEQFIYVRKYIDGLPADARALAGKVLADLEDALNEMKELILHEGSNDKTGSAMEYIWSRHNILGTIKANLESLNDLAQVVKDAEKDTIKELKTKLDKLNTAQGKKTIARVKRELMQLQQYLATMQDVHKFLQGLSGEQKTAAAKINSRLSAKAQDLKNASSKKKAALIKKELVRLEEYISIIKEASNLLSELPNEVKDFADDIITRLNSAIAALNTATGEKEVADIMASVERLEDILNSIQEPLALIAQLKSETKSKYNTLLDELRNKLVSFKDEYEKAFTQDAEDITRAREKAKAVSIKKKQLAKTSPWRIIARRRLEQEIAALEKEKKEKAAGATRAGLLKKSFAQTLDLLSAVKQTDDFLAKLSEKSKKADAKTIDKLSSKLSKLNSARDKKAVARIKRSIAGLQEYLATAESINRLLETIPQDTKVAASYIVAEIVERLAQIKTARGVKAIDAIKKEIDKLTLSLNIVKDAKSHLDALTEEEKDAYGQMVDELKEKIDTLNTERDQAKIATIKGDIARIKGRLTQLRQGIFLIYPVIYADARWQAHRKGKDDIINSSEALFAHVIDSYQIWLKHHPIAGLSQREEYLETVWEGFEFSKRGPPWLDEIFKALKKYIIANKAPTFTDKYLPADIKQKMFDGVVVNISSQSRDHAQANPAIVNIQGQQSFPEPISDLRMTISENEVVLEGEGINRWHRLGKSERKAIKAGLKEANKAIANGKELTLSIEVTDKIKHIAEYKEGTLYLHWFAVRAPPSHISAEKFAAYIRGVIYEELAHHYYPDINHNGVDRFVIDYIRNKPDILASTVEVLEKDGRLSAGEWLHLVRLVYTYEQSNKAARDEIQSEQPSADVIVITAGTKEMADTYRTIYESPSRKGITHRPDVPVLFIPDPEGLRVGNGGALAHSVSSIDKLLSRLADNYPHLEGKALEDLRIVVVQAGGFGSRISLTLAHGSKTLMGLPVILPNGHMSAIMDLVLIGAYKFTQELKRQDRSGIVVLNGDGLLVARPELKDGISIITYPEKKEDADGRLGVISKDAKTGRVLEFLEKPSLDQMENNHGLQNDPDFAGEGIVAANTASFIVSGTGYAEFLRQLLVIARIINDTSAERFEVDTSNELFILRYLKDDPEGLEKHIAKRSKGSKAKEKFYREKILPIVATFPELYTVGNKLYTFYRDLGTTDIYLIENTKDGALAKIYSFFRRVDSFVAGSGVSAHACVYQSYVSEGVDIAPNSIIYNSDLYPGSKVGSDSIVSATGRVKVEGGQILMQLPAKTKDGKVGFAIFFNGVFDNVKGLIGGKNKRLFDHSQSDRATIFGVAVEEWLKLHGLLDEHNRLSNGNGQPIELAGRTVFDLPIWPILASGEIDMEIVEWMATYSSQPSKKYLEAPKMTLQEITDSQQSREIYNLIFARRLDRRGKIKSAANNIHKGTHGKDILGFSALLMAGFFFAKNAYAAGAETTVAETGLFGIISGLITQLGWPLLGIAASVAAIALGVWVVRRMKRINREATEASIARNQRPESIAAAREFDQAENKYTKYLYRLAVLSGIRERRSKELKELKKEIRTLRIQRKTSSDEYQEGIDESIKEALSHKRQQAAKLRYALRKLAEFNKKPLVLSEKEELLILLAEDESGAYTSWFNDYIREYNHAPSFPERQNKLVELLDKALYSMALSLYGRRNIEELASLEIDELEQNIERTVGIIFTKDLLKGYLLYTALAREEAIEELPQDLDATLGIMRNLLIAKLASRIKQNYDSYVDTAEKQKVRKISKLLAQLEKALVKGITELLKKANPQAQANLFKHQPMRNLAASLGS
ncbi:MAG: hypothetical protein JW869_07605, partial [Candidatus Omnitrophica bacterium]|nr:hypothetical protein [Candidatus Omnitrophota bacterium]